MASKNKYSTETVIRALKKARGIKAVAAKILGCDRHTVDNYIKRHPTVAKAYQEQRETLIDVAEGKLITKIDGDEWPAIKFVLATLGKDRGYTERHEIAGVLRRLDLSELSTVQLERIVAGEDVLNVLANRKAGRGGADSEGTG